MADITMCKIKDCDVSGLCKRHSNSGTKANPNWQAYFSPRTPGRGCGYFWPVRVESGSCNVFADLGLPDAEKRLADAVIKFRGRE
jgi:hypothetical protein